MTEQCEYTVEVPASFSEELDGWDDEIEGWTCQRDTAQDYCLYHRDQQDTDNQALQDQFRDEATKDADTPLELIGATFEYLNLNDITTTRPIYLIEATFDEVCIRDSDFEAPIYFYDASFDRCDFTHSTFKAAYFDGEVSITDGVFSHTHFYKATFADATFQEASFDNAVLDDVTFASTDILREAHFEEAIFGAGSVLTDAYFARADFTDATVQSSNLEDADLSNTILFGADFRGSRVAGARFSGAQVDDETKILGDPSTETEEGHEYSLSALLSKERCVYDPKATFGEDVRNDLLTRDKNPLTETDLRDRARRVYRTLESLGQQAARPQLQAQSFVRRKSAARRQYRADMLDSDGYTGGERTIAAFRWLRAEASRSIFLYGESPWRILGWSGIFILVFGVIFAFGGHVTTTGTGLIQTSISTLFNAPIQGITAILDAIYYSMLVYTTLGFSTFHMVGLGRALGVLEASIGIIMASLLVFVLGRRAAR